MLSGPNVTLRMLRESDLDTYYALINSIERRGPYFPHDFESELSMRNAFKENGWWGEGFGRLLICHDDRPVGTIMYIWRDRGCNGLEIGYIIFDDADRGKGYTTEAVNLLVRYFFATRNINRIQISLIPDNEASKRVALRAGFKLEGITRGGHFHRGRHWDLENYSILRDEVTIE